MPNFSRAPVWGRYLFAGAAALAAGAAFAADRPEVVVQQPLGDTRVVAVKVSDLDLDRAYDQKTLAIRINKATRQVCDIAYGSVVDKLPSARACVDKARAGALAQIEARGLSIPASLATGGMQ